jgi:hypothetical protein
VDFADQARRRQRVRFLGIREQEQEEEEKIGGGQVCVLQG